LNSVKDESEAFIIGGGSIYRQFFPLARKLYLTLVHQDFEADVWFPDIDYSQWEVVAREDLFDEKNGFNYSNLDLKRK
jgi:dihydrofolate reductase